MTDPSRPTWRMATQLVRGGLARSANCETSEALYLNSGYVYESALEAEQSFDGTKDRFVYSRFANPTIAMFEERLRLLEGAEACRATASGMAAVHAALLCYLKTGDRVVASRALFGSCAWILTDLLPRYGIAVDLVDGADATAWQAALAQPVRAVFIETPANPTLELVDIALVAELTHRAGGLLIVDNVFATPLLQRPLALGADLVVYSATKHIDGQGRCLGGAVLCSAAFLNDHLGPFLRHCGPALSPFNAWVLLKGLETLPLRVARHVENAERIAGFLESHAGIARVLYPGLPSHPQHDLALRQMAGGGPIVAFEPKGGKVAAFRLQDRLTLIDISNNLGDAKSLITHPWTTTHASRPVAEKLQMGVSEGLLRLSVGLEDVEDLIEDLSAALAP
jgi:O-succinylhomoserine sulfhydrylase